MNRLSHFCPIFGRFIRSRLRKVLGSSLRINPPEIDMAEEMIAVMNKMQLGVHLDVRGATTAAGPGPLLKRVTIRGAAQGRGSDAKSPHDLTELPGGYAMTLVPKSHWDAWCRNNQGSPLLKSGMIFAHEKPREAEAKARDQATLKSGFEPLVPDEPQHRVKTLDRQDIQALA